MKGCGAFQGDECLCLLDRVERLHRRRSDLLNVRLDRFQSLRSFVGIRSPLVEEHEGGERRDPVLGGKGSHLVDVHPSEKNALPVQVFADPQVLRLDGDALVAPARGEAHQDKLVSSYRRGEVGAGEVGVSCSKDWDDGIAQRDEGDRAVVPCKVSGSVKVRRGATAVSDEAVAGEVNA